MAPIAHSPRTPPLAPSPSALRLLLPSILLLALSACVLASEEPQPLRTLVRPQHAGGLAHSRRTQGRALAARLGAQAAASPSVPGAALPSAGPESRAGGEGGGDGGEGTEMGPPLLSPEKFVDPLPRPTVVSGSQGPITLGMYATTQKFHRDIPPTKVYAYGTSQETASVPGPTIEALRGVDTHVTWVNEIRDAEHMFVVDKSLLVANPTQGVPTVVHRHGGETNPAHDGAPNSWYTAFNETGSTYSTNQYQYSNLQEPTTLWYHDHTVGLTNLNLAAGLFGAYILRDPNGMEAKLSLPQGEYEMPLVLTDRAFLPGGAIFYPSKGDNPDIHPHWLPEYFGNAQIVNGKVWPYLAAERAAYRFRIINAANARAYNLSFICATPQEYPNFTYPLKGLPITFYLIGTDGGYLNAPVRVKSVLVGVAQRADIVVDLAAYPGCADVIVTNDANAPFPSGDPVDGDSSLVMRITVANATGTATNVQVAEPVFVLPTKLNVSGLVMRVTVANATGTAAQVQVAEPVLALPKKLNSIEGLNFSGVLTVRHLPMTELADPRTDAPLESLMGNLHWTDPATETPVYGSTEVWNLINTTPDNHPVHVHLIQFRLISRQNFDVDGYANGSCSFSNPLLRSCLIGAPVPAAPEEAGWHDTILTPPAEVTTILLKFATQAGGAFDFDPTAAPGYSWHCHILNHEDNQKMRPLKILPGLKAEGKANAESSGAENSVPKGSELTRPLTAFALTAAFLVAFCLL